MSGKKSKSAKPRPAPASKAAGSAAAKKPALSHLNEQGEARMVDVGEKSPTRRRAVASAEVRVGAAAARAVRENRVAKGNVFEVARLAGIAAAKRTAELIPLCHNLPLDHVEVALRLRSNVVEIRVEASAFARTGVEMEAMTAASVAALTVYDMLKAIDKGMRIGPVLLLEKSGGKSGTWKVAKSGR